MPRPLSVLVLALALLLGSPAVSSPARADADDGVHVDPDSAPAAEYALPLDAARRAALGSSGERDGAGGGGGGGGVAPPPAFGSGISPKPTAPAPGRSRARGGVAPPSDGGARAQRSEPTAPRADATPTSIADAGGDPMLYSLGGALAVLAAGGLLALTLRRRQSTV